MEILKGILTGLYLVVCLAVIVLATLQTKDSSGASGTITGSSTNNFFEKNKGNTREGKMKKWTITSGVVFVVLAVVLVILNNVL